MLNHTTKYCNTISQTRRLCLDNLTKQEDKLKTDVMESNIIHTSLPENLA